MDGREKEVVYFPSASVSELRSLSTLNHVRPFAVYRVSHEVHYVLRFCMILLTHSFVPYTLF